MKRPARLVILSVFILVAMAFSAIGAMAMASSPAAASKNEVVGVITAMDATSITINGTVYNLMVGAEIKGNFMVGDTVKIEFFVNPDGSITAYEVSAPASSGATVEPTGTETEISTEPVSTEDSFGTPEPTSMSTEPVETKSVSTEPVSTESFSPDRRSGNGSSESSLNAAAGNPSGDAPHHYSGHESSGQGSSSGNQNPDSGGQGNSNGD